jgi:ribosomal protein S18 acetylase RimI-like enzyme
VIIRRLLSTDAQALKILRCNAAATSPRSIYPTVAEIEAQTLASFFSDIESENTIGAFGAFIDDDLVGFVGVRRDNRLKMRHKAQIWGMYVMYAHRKQGIARALLSAAIDAAREMPETITVLLSVDSEGVAAKSLYASLGFEVYGIERDCILVDGVYVHEERMRLALR